MSEAELIALAIQAREQAFAPYSKFKVGAVLVAEDGTAFTGCNVESASYGLTLCAERTALVKGVSEGHRKFRCVVVVADTQRLTPPCGACRQMLWEFAPEAYLILANLNGVVERHTVAALLPSGFDGSLLVTLVPLGGEGLG